MPIESHNCTICGALCNEKPEIVTYNLPAHMAVLSCTAHGHLGIYPVETRAECE